MIRLFLVSIALAAGAFGQSLQVIASAGGTVSALPPGGSITLPSNGVGQAAVGSVTVQNTGTASVTITAISITGTSEITLMGSPAFPITLTPNGSAGFLFQYLPTTVNATTAQVSIAFTANGQTSAFPFTLNGVAPNLAFSYFLPPNGSATTANPGDRIAFPDTNMGASSTVILSVVNRGSAAGSIQSAAVTGAGFTLTGSPAPVLLQPGAQASFTVSFSPQASGSQTGSLILGINGISVAFPLIGTGAAPNLIITYALADGNVRQLTDGTAVLFPSIDINGTTTATIEITNQGTGAGSVSGVSLAGAPFRFSNLPLLPATVAAGQTLRFGVVFAPTEAGTFSGSLRITGTNRSVSATLSGSTAPSNISLSYVEPDTNSIIRLSDGSSIVFANTQVNTSSTITVVAANSGAGSGRINSITLGGSSPAAFQLLSLPPLPLSIPPSQELRFGIRFSPQQQQTFSGVLTVNLSNGQTQTVNLRAQGTGPQFTYEYSNESGTNPVAPGGTISLMATDVGQTSSVAVVVRNSGSGTGTISSITVTGQGLSVSEAPALPATLEPQSSRSFTLNFAPTQPGAVNGRLLIGNDTFSVSATAIGSRLTYTYRNAVSTVPVTADGTVIFPPTPVGDRGTLEFAIQNTGTSPATISSVNLAQPSTIFALQQLPSLPIILDPGARIGFPITFTPNNIGTLTASLRVNNVNFTLSGSGDQPANLPPFEFQAPGGDPQPAQQPSIGLSLTSPYPYTVQGSLQLTFVSSVFTDDPAVQFASSGRTVSFTIPANTTQAVFHENATTIALQTGTTAGSIIIKPSFAMQNGFDLTPSSAHSLTLNVARSAPRLLSASITSQTLTSFTLVLSGYSTTRAMRQLDVQITPRSGESFSATNLTIDVTSASSAWFQGASSQAFGGAFLIAIPFSLQNGGSNDDLVRRLQSLSITATNEVGISAALSVAIP